MELKSSIDVLNNIGEKRKEALNSIGIYTLQDLINYYPKSYEDRSKIINIEDLALNTYGLIKVKITKSPTVLNFKSVKIVKVFAVDETDMIELIWFNQVYIKNSLKLNKEYLIFGKVSFQMGKLQMIVSDFEENKNISLNNNRIIPIYSLPKSVPQKIFRKIMFDALSSIEEEIEDFFPENILRKYNLCGLMWATKKVHYPDLNEDFYKARERLVFNELFFLEGSLKTLKILAKEKTEIKIKDLDYNIIKKLLPFKLTMGQEKVLDEIMEDMKKSITMNRLISGDVGSGKTLIAIISAFIAIKNGYSACLMAPTEVLANQHYIEFKKYFDLLGIDTVLLTGSIKGKKKKETLEEIYNFSGKMVIGTHALIQKKVDFNNLALVITDEQHRFGVKQRGLLFEKGINPHMLVMSATPIPRTLALCIYGDLDISSIDELPKGRQKIETCFVNSQYRKGINKKIMEEIEKGHQVYIICPAIEENENTSLKAVLTYTKDLKKLLNNINIESIHGKMKQDEKDIIMDKFYKNEINVLVSTTVIEVGINVPNATLIIIEDSHRFGLSSLHQLRGRVGRSHFKSYCVLVSDIKTKISKERLEIMTQTNDGFVLANKDLELRGQGDFFGSRQAGIPEFRIANLNEDIEILKLVNQLWEEYLLDNSIFEKYSQVIKDKTKDFLGMNYGNIYL